MYNLVTIPFNYSKMLKEQVFITLVCRHTALNCTYCTALNSTYIVLYHFLHLTLLFTILDSLTGLFLLAPVRPQTIRLQNHILENHKFLVHPLTYQPPIPAIGARKGFLRRNIVAVKFSPLYTFPFYKYKTSKFTEAWLCSEPEIYISNTEYKDLLYTSKKKKNKLYSDNIRKFYLLSSCNVLKL